MFKFKPDKTRQEVKINTIDGTHKKITTQFNKNRCSLPNKKIKLEKLEKQLNKIDKKEKSLLTIEDIKKKSMLKNNINMTQQDITDIDNNYDELEYLYMISDILVDYYDNEPKIVANQVDVDNTPTDALTTQKNNESEFNFTELEKLNNSRKTKTKKVPKKRWKKTNKSKASNIISMLKNSQNSTTDGIEFEPVIQRNISRKKKAVMLDDFLTLTNPNYISEKKHRYNPSVICPKCNSIRVIIHSDGICVCKICGEAEYIIVDSDRPNYKDNMPEKSGYPYKRIDWCRKVSHHVHLGNVYDKMLVILVKNSLNCLMNYFKYSDTSDCHV
jgi:hypothetical protein